jgi:rubrerythrin
MNKNYKHSAHPSKPKPGGGRSSKKALANNTLSTPAPGNNYPYDDFVRLVPEGRKCYRCGWWWAADDTICPICGRSRSVKK